MTPMTSLSELGRALDDGRISSAALTDSAITRAEDPDGEGESVFIALAAGRARAEAEASDRLRAAGIVASPIAGLPISVKDLFDVAGEATTAGSRTLAEAPAARRDSVVVARLRGAGAVIVGRTNMTEFAYSGIGINPHFGTPGTRGTAPPGASRAARRRARRCR